MDTSVESCPVGESHNQSESSRSSSDVPVFPNKFRLNAQSYVSSPELSFSKMSSSSSGDDTYEPSTNSSQNSESTSLSSDEISWDRIVAECSYESISSMPYTFTSLPIDFTRNMTSGHTNPTHFDREAAPSTRVKRKEKILSTSSKKGPPKLRIL
jgi:hypothetical protein